MNIKNLDEINAALAARREQLKLLTPEQLKVLIADGFKDLDAMNTKVKFNIIATHVRGHAAHRLEFKGHRETRMRHYATYIDCPNIMESQILPDQKFIEDMYDRGCGIYNERPLLVVPPSWEV